MKRIILILLLILPLIASSQNKLLDSLEQVILIAPKDTLRIDALNTLAFKLKYKENSRASQLASEATQLAQQLGTRKRWAKALYIHAYILQIAGNYQEAVNLINQSLTIAEADNDFNRQAYNHGLLGIIYGRWTNHEKAMLHNLKSRNFFKLTGDTLTLTAINTNIGSLYEERGVYDSALVFYFESLEYKQASGNTWAGVTELLNIGAAYHKLKEYDLALDYNQQGIAQSMKSPNKPILDLLYNNRGEIFLELLQFDSAAHFAQTAFDISKNKKQPYHQLPSIYLMGKIHLNRKELELAESYFQEGLMIARKIENMDYWSKFSSELGGLYLQLDKNKKAIQYLTEAFEIGKAITGYLHLEKTSQQLATAYEKIGNHQQALFFFKKNKTFQDSLAGLEKSKYLVELERQYRTTKQAKELAEKDLAISKQDSKMRIFILGSLLILFFLIGLFQYFRYHSRLSQREAKISLELQRAKAQQLGELSQLRTTFFTNISHEFRTPLTLIMQPIEDALDEMENNEMNTETSTIAIKTKHLQIIKSNTIRLHSLVNQILDLAKLDSGQMLLRVGEGQLIKFIRFITFSFESLAEKQQIKLVTSFPAELDSAWFDEDKLEKILVNLLSNAFKFTPLNGIISVVVEKESKGLKIKISDSGQGMNSETVAKIFDRFYQAETTKSQGSGIGLSLVKELVALHRGKISVESQLGHGTTFSLLLPYERHFFQPNEIHEIEKDHEPESAHLFLQKNNNTITFNSSTQNLQNKSDAPLLLIVEDNPDLRFFLAETLQKNYEIILSKNGKSGLEKAIEHLPDLIISDVMMPEMDGMEMSKILKKDERTSHIPIILLTAKAGSQEKLEGLETGADAYLTKPFNKKELFIRIKNLIEERRLLREKFGAEIFLHPTSIENTTSVDAQFLKKITTIIESNLSNELFSVEDLAHEVQFSRSQVYRKLKALTNKSPNEMIRAFRLARAKELLEKGVGNVSEVAILTGFNSLSYFTKSFKAEFGKLPSNI